MFKRSRHPLPLPTLIASGAHTLRRIRTRALSIYCASEQDSDANCVMSANIRCILS